MKAFTELNLGFANAENYRRRDNKELLQKYFVRDSYLDDLLDPNVYFLVGEKGTGKTAYSTYLKNNRYKNKHAFTYDVRQTEFQKFMELKKRGYLPLSNYAEVWRVILLMMCAASVLEDSKTPQFLERFTKLNNLRQAIDDYYQNAFSPEIVKVIDILEASEEKISILAKYGLLSGGAEEKSKTEVKDSFSRFQTNLASIRRYTEVALSSLSLDEDFIVFIDGIDVRPSDISYDEYFDCVRGLIEAVWNINSDFLANIKDSRGRIRVVLLVRPDIFLRTGLHNLNTKIRDNSVFLNWKTSYKDYRSSSLFRIADRILSVQQDESLDDGVAWDYYFPFQAENIKFQDTFEEPSVNSFLAFLRFSYYRPRDINQMMETMRGFLQNRGSVQYASADDFNDPSFRDAHADYLLGEVRDQMLFYYSQDDFDQFLKFFSYLNGRVKFTYVEFSESLNSFAADCASSGVKLPRFMDSCDTFLQFLYEQNVICYKEFDDEDVRARPFIRWCFRERTPSNLAPKVRTHTEYEIFYGLTKALNVGRKVRSQRVNNNRELGTISALRFDKGFGFIRGGRDQADHYFKISDLPKNVKFKVGDKVSFQRILKLGKLRASEILRSR